MVDVASSVSEAKDSRPLAFGMNLMWPWIVANFAAFAIAGAVGGGVLRALIAPYFGSDVAVMEAARIQGTAAGLAAAIHGALIGTAQWLVLRRSIRAGWWLPVTLAGWAACGAILGFAAGGSTSTIGPAAGPLHPLINLLVLPPLLVLLLSGGQWLILRREVDSVGPWFVVNGGAYLVAWISGVIVAKMLPWIAGTKYPSAQGLLVVGLIAGPFYGWLTWQFLSDLRRRRPDPEVA